MTRKYKTVRTYKSQLNSDSWWAYNNRGIALEDLANFSSSQKDCGKVIDFTPRSTQNLDFTPTTFKTKTSQLTGAFLGMTEQFKNSFFRAR